MKLKKSALIKVVSILAVMTAMITPAFALLPATPSLVSATTTKTVYGYTYTFYSAIGYFHGPFDGIQGATGVETSTGLPTGYIGTRTRIYSSSADLVQINEWEYSCENAMGALRFGYHDPSSTPEYSYYYSRGQVQLYNGDGYTQYNCSRTPNLPAEETESISIELNAAGEIYGSELLLEMIGVEPDLISAVGQNGAEGYIKRTDLDYNLPSNPAEAMEYMANRPARRTIPLYAEDGVTVLGSFVIDNTTPSGELIP